MQFDVGSMFLKPLLQGFMMIFGMWQMWAFLIFVLALRVLPWLLEQIRFSRAGLDDVDRMGGIEFERYLENLFRRQGYWVQVTPPSGDQGADLLLSGKGQMIAVQAKCHRKAVGNKAVQEVVAARGFYRCDRAMVVANREFTRAARELAAANQVELVGRHELASMIISLGARPGSQGESVTPTPIVAQQSVAAQPAVPVCERCGRPMVKRKGRRGEFWGCSGYPHCHFTRDL